MGCASSAPLVEQGKHLVEGVKDTANETIAKGEKAIDDTTGTIKDGVDTVKETMKSAFNTAEESVGSVAQKIGETFHITTSKTSDIAEEAKEHLSTTMAATTEAAGEAVSEAETVIVSETEHAREAFKSGTSPFFETVHSFNNEFEETLKDNMETKEFEDLEARFHDLDEDLEKAEADQSMKKGEELLMEDLENEHHLGANVTKLEDKVEELTKDETEEMIFQKQQPQKEELPPTLWEAAADAILLKRTIMKLEPLHDRLFLPPSEKPVDLTAKKTQENDIIVENSDSS